MKFNEVAINPRFNELDRQIIGNDAKWSRYIYTDLTKSGVVIASYSRRIGWEHVTMDIKFPQSRVPNYQEMSWLKDKFWDDSEVTMQVLPAEKDYVNNHPYVLHLWRRMGQTSKFEKSICQQKADAHKEALELSSGKSSVFFIGGNERKVAICGGNVWPKWEEIRSIKNEFFGKESAALIFTLGEKQDLDNGYVVLLWDAKNFELPPKELV